MMQVPVPQHLGSSDMCPLLKRVWSWAAGCLKNFKTSCQADQRPAVALAFSHAIKMRSGVAGASMYTTALWLALAATASRKAKKAYRPNIKGGSPVALLLKGVGLRLALSNKDTLKCSGMSPATGIL